MIEKFEGKYRFLSNFYESPFVLDGLEYSSVEHYYQSKKCADEILQEGNTWGDKFWGVDLRTKVGENHLGKLLMKIRAEFRDSS